jgi:two-component system invasion response regulator UvrY
MSFQSIRILLADDHAIVRSGLRRLIEQRQGMAVVAEAESGEQAYQQFSECLPDVAVMDLSMPGMGGMEAVRRILVRHPHARIVVYSMHENASFATQALRAGARGYLAKTGAPDELLTALQEVARGKTYLGTGIAQKIAMQSLDGGSDPIGQLSAREFDVFRMIAEGLSTDEIAAKLKISQKTVANYLTIIKQKLGVSTSIEMLRLAMRYGVIDQ